MKYGFLPQDFSKYKIPKGKVKRKSAWVVWVDNNQTDLLALGMTDKEHSVIETLIVFHFLEFLFKYAPDAKLCCPFETYDIPINFRSSKR